MNTSSDKIRRQAAAWILKVLQNNEDWQVREKEDSIVNYYYVPLLEIAQNSKKYNISILKDATYLLMKNKHVDIWGDDYDPYGMLVKVLDEGIEAQKKSFYLYNGARSWLKRSLLSLGIFAWLLPAPIHFPKNLSILKPFLIKWIHYF